MIKAEEIPAQEVELIHFSRKLAKTGEASLKAAGLNTLPWTDIDVVFGIGEPSIPFSSLRVAAQVAESLIRAVSNNEDANNPDLVIDRLRGQRTMAIAAAAQILGRPISRHNLSLQTTRVPLLEPTAYYSEKEIKTFRLEFGRLLKKNGYPAGYSPKTREKILADHAIDPDDVEAKFIEHLDMADIIFDAVKKKSHPELRPTDKPYSAYFATDRETGQPFIEIHTQGQTEYSIDGQANHEKGHADMEAVRRASIENRQINAVFGLTHMYDRDAARQEAVALLREHWALAEHEKNNKMFKIERLAGIARIIGYSQANYDLHRNGMPIEEVKKKTKQFLPLVEEERVDGTVEDLANDLQFSVYFNVFMPTLKMVIKANRLAPAVKNMLLHQWMTEPQTLEQMQATVTEARLDYQAYYVNDSLI